MTSNTLIIKHLPYQFSTRDKEDFLKECGAIKVNVKSSKIRKYNVAFAQFPTAALAERALHHLHQQEVLGSYLVAEYAKNEDWTKPISIDDSTRITPSEERGTDALVKRFIEKLSRWVTGTDLRVPVPSHLRYQYPPPTPATIQNIAHLLQTTPKLYTQVLHLINKMNLPCPISNEPIKAPSFHPPVQEPPPFLLLSSNSESELSSGGEGQHRETIPKLLHKQKRPVKKRKLVKPISNISSSTLKQHIEEVFEDPKSLLEEPKTKKLKPNLDNTVSVKEKAGVGFIASIHPEAEGFGLLQPVTKAQEPPLPKPEVDIRDPREEERLEKKKIEAITKEALAANRIAEKDRTLLPVFKNYAEGSPTCRLYIKNLAKTVTEDDLRFIYNRYQAEEYAETTNMFDIRLMQEGRMKGQAFVTLQNVELAKKALAETNGYILLDKPMVVQFARSATK